MGLDRLQHGLARDQQQDTQESQESLKGGGEEKKKLRQSESDRALSISSDGYREQRAED